MKKTKRTLALVGAVLLILLYLSTLILAIVDHSHTMGVFKLAISLTILVPVLIYGYTLIYRVTKKDDTSDDQ